MAGRIKRISHNILFHRAEWEANPPVRALRENPQLVHQMYAERHVELHQTVSSVPVISSMMALRAMSVFDTFTESKDPLQAIDNLQRAIDRARRSRYSDVIEKEIASVALHAIEMQKPFFYPSLPATVIALKPRTQQPKEDAS